MCVLGFLRGLPGNGQTSVQPETFPRLSWTCGEVCLQEVWAPLTSRVGQLNPENQFLPHSGFEKGFGFLTRESTPESAPGASLSPARCLLPVPHRAGLTPTFPHG